MQKKAQMDGLGTILVIFLTILVGLILFVAAAQEMGKSRDTLVIDNLVFTAPENLTAYYFTDYKSFTGTITVTNNSDGIAIASTNYTITNNVIDPTTGGLSVRLIPAADCPTYCERDWNISVSVAQPLGYIDNGGARSVAGMIIIFFALGIAIVVLVPTLRNGLIESFS